MHSTTTIPHKKCTTTLCMLAYGSITHSIGEYIRTRKGLALECLERLYMHAILYFDKECSPYFTVDGLRLLLAQMEKREFPSLIGSINYMH